MFFSRRKKSVCTDETYSYEQTIHENCLASLRKTVKLNISYGSVHNIVHKDLHLFPYRSSTQSLSRDDRILRVKSYYCFKVQIPQDMSSVIFSDGATFKTDGHVDS